jgi:FAD synthase
MKTKASVLTIRVPKELKHRIERIADEQGVSINQLALYAFTREIAQLEASSYFSNRVKYREKKVILEDFDTVMGKIKTAEPPEWDAM